MPNAVTVVKYLRKQELPLPPPALITLVRGKRDRITPELKALAIVIGLQWDGVRAEAIAEVRDDLSRSRAIKADKEKVLHEVVEAIDRGEALPVDVFGSKTHVAKREFLEQTDQISYDELFRPAYHERKAVFALLYGEGFLEKWYDPKRPRRLNKHRFIDYEVISPNARENQSGDFMLAWDRYQQWKSTLKGGGVSIAAELAGVSRAAASKWLKELREPLDHFMFEEEESSDEEWQKLHDEWDRKRKLNPNVSYPDDPPPTFSSQIRRLIYDVYVKLTNNQRAA